MKELEATTLRHISGKTNNVCFSPTEASIPLSSGISTHPGVIVETREAKGTIAKVGVLGINRESDNKVPGIWSGKWVKLEDR